MYADSISEAMEKAIKETERRRCIQDTFNKKHNLKPVTIKKEIREDISNKIFEDIERPNNKKALRIQISEVERLMKNAAKELDFEKAAEYRDLLFELKTLI